MTETKFQSWKTLLFEHEYVFDAGARWVLLEMMAHNLSPSRFSHVDHTTNILAACGIILPNVNVKNDVTARQN